MKRLLHGIGVLALVLLLGIGALVLLGHHDREVPAGAEQLYDDTGYSVLACTRQGARLTIDVRVWNHAKRIHIRPGTFHVRVLDRAGDAHEELDGLATHPREDLAPEESVVEQHVVDLPQGAEPAALELSFGRFADAADWLFLGRRSYALP